jgi:hypothetical protein
MGADPLTEIYNGHVNSADQSIMISPPWVLGIQGGARLANMLGENPTLRVIDSKFLSGAWGGLSTDAGSNFMMNVVNAKVAILPKSKGGMSSGNFRYSHKYGSGYGSYIIGDAQQYFYGIQIRGSTYASILAGGDGYFRSSRGDIELKDADGGSLGPAVSNSVTLNLTNGHYKGNVFNGTGYYTQLGDALEVNIGKHAALKGAISLTETRHVDENGDQNTHFTIDDYYYLGHVENRKHRNGNSSISVSLTDGAIWKVTGESYTSSLIVEDGAIVGTKGKTVAMTVDGEPTPIQQGQRYEGAIVIQLEKKNWP